MVWCRLIFDTGSRNISRIDRKLLLNTSYMMTLSNGNILHVTGTLYGKFTSHRWIPLTKATDVELWYFLWVNNRDTGDLRRHGAYDDVTAMYEHNCWTANCGLWYFSRDGSSIFDILFGDSPTILVIFNIIFSVNKCSIFLYSILKCVALEYQCLAIVERRIEKKKKNNMRDLRFDEFVQKSIPSRLWHFHYCSSMIALESTKLF